MPVLKIAIVYFSATNVTHTYARTIQERLVNRGCMVQLFNVTPHGSREKPLSFEDFNGVIFGFPVYSDFAPTVINEWIPKLDGRGKRSTLFFTYGGRTTGYAHFQTNLLLEQAGFCVLLSAEFLGRHAFHVGGWGISLGRPNADDLSLAEEYGDLAVKLISEPAPVVLRLQKPFGYNQVILSLGKRQKIIERQWKNPVRVTECSMCGACGTECPTQSFDVDTGLSNPRDCISCMHCVYICPEKAIKIEEKKNFYQHFLLNWHLTEEMMNAKKSKIIAEPWQAAS